MPRPQGGQTLELSPEDHAELLALCADDHDASKKWLGGVFLRYGMNHPEEAKAENTAAVARTTRDRRAGKRKAN